MAIFISDGTPIMFAQERPGLKGEVFTMYKFRTMRAPKRRGRRLPDERRISKMGYLLRITSLDELPELWNVLRGEMSLIGPRPLLVRYLKHYDEEQIRRHDVLPGITGWAQINGRNVQTWDQRFAHDIWYVDNWSFLLDLKILAKTFIIVMKREGVSPTDGTIMEEFKGIEIIEEEPKAKTSDSQQMNFINPKKRKTKELKLKKQEQQQQQQPQPQMTFSAQRKPLPRS